MKQREACAKRASISICVVTAKHIPSLGVPHAHSSVHPAARNPHAVERHRVYLVNMAPENVETLARVDVPEPTRMIVATADDAVATHIECAHAVLVPDEYSQQTAPLNIPDAQGTVPRTRDGDRPIMQYFQAADRRAMPREPIDAIPIKRASTRISRERAEGGTYPDLTSQTRRSLSHPPLTTSAFGCPQPSDVPAGSLGLPGLGGTSNGVGVLAVSRNTAGVDRLRNALVVGTLSNPSAPRSVGARTCSRTPSVVLGPA